MRSPCETCVQGSVCDTYGGSCRRKEAYDRWKVKAAEIGEKGRKNGKERNFENIGDGHR